MAYGRGGAGNIEAAALESARKSADPEANRQGAKSDGKNGPPEEVIDVIAREEQQYQHLGRGGAGNFYSPKDLSKSGKFSDAHRSHIVGDGTLQPASALAANLGNGPPSYNAAKPSTESVRSYGRGGAGNYSQSAAEIEAARVKREEERIKIRLQADIEKAVQESLAMPQKAKVHNGEDA